MQVIPDVSGVRHLSWQTPHQRQYSCANLLFPQLVVRYSEQIVSISVGFTGRSQDSGPVGQIFLAYTPQLGQTANAAFQSDPPSSSQVNLGWFFCGGPLHSLFSQTAEYATSSGIPSSVVPWSNILVAEDHVTKPVARMWITPLRSTCSVSNTMMADRTSTTVVSSALRMECQMMWRTQQFGRTVSVVGLHKKTIQD
jgi:hypothetical protein